MELPSAAAKRHAIRLPFCLDDRAKQLITYSLSLSFCAFVLGALPLYTFLKLHILNYEDDAYYYFVIARNIHDLGLSTFDQQTITNGYQPLWLVVLLLEYALCGTFDYTLIIELILLMGALAFLLAALRAKGAADNAVLTLAFVLSVAGFTLNGMEGALLVFCLSALFWAIERLDSANRTHAAAIGVLAALAIGARIDAGVFVLPLIVLAMPSPKGRLIALGVVGLAGLCYGLGNIAVFGSAVPLSAAVKSLGGLQFNRHLFEDFGAQIFESDRAEAARCMVDLSCGNTNYYWIVLLIPITLGLLSFAKPDRFQRALLLAFLIGLGAYGVKLFFLSSWSIWPWYFFPVFIGAYAAIRATHTLLSRWQEAPRGKVLRAAGAVILLGLVALPVAQYLSSPPGYDWQGFAILNQRAVERFGTKLNGARIAMGDRAGSFAFNYEGPVTQLEGLVEDRTYLKLIEGQGDLRALLCERGVKYIAAYAVELGDYKAYRLRALRPWLTSFPGPSLEVRKSDEVGRISDLAVFDSKDLGDEGDSYLYIWRLSGCAQREASANSSRTVR